MCSHLPVTCPWVIPWAKTKHHGSTKQIDYVIDIMDTAGSKSCVNIVDPAMADNGALYPAFDQEYVEAMKKLCGTAEIILPNITEAAFLTGMDYRESYDEAYITALAEKLADLGTKTVVLTGVSYTSGKTGVAVYEKGQLLHYEHKRIPKSYHGTGDVYSSAFVGALMNDKSVFEAAKVAASYTVKCIENTIDDPCHFYGVKFETALPELWKLI